jgi:rhodanese-related sulfurtransferase
VTQRANTPLEIHGVRTMLSHDRIQRYKTDEVNYLPLVAPQGQPCFFPSSEEAREFYAASQDASEGRFMNRITFESLERLASFEAATRIEAISPTPLRMILAKKDFLIPMDIALDAYARAHEPKSLVFTDGGHLCKSEGENFEIASAAARDWFVQWLKPSNLEAPVVDSIPQISVKELKRKLDAKEDVFVVDVREPHEHKIANLGATLIPVGEIERRASELADKKNSEIVVYCKAGVRSQKAALALKQAGFTNISNLTGGILAWAEKIDPSMPKY